VPTICKTIHVDYSAKEVGELIMRHALIRLDNVVGVVEARSGVDLHIDLDDNHNPIPGGATAVIVLSPVDQGQPSDLGA
jgi:hypothetical protein